MDDLTGQRLNDYQLLRLLGRGAMAAVYLAEQASLSRRVAVKVLSAELGRSEPAVDRFRREARAAAALVHANIVQVYEVGRWEDRHYLSQEYVAGGTLGDVVGRDGRVAPDKALTVLWQVGSALAVAAERGVVHRDIKPDNLMVDRSGAVKVADFGLARLVEPDSPRLTQEGLTMGTPLYMSPEQVEGKPLDPRSDLYSLGATVFHLLTGEPPFEGPTPLAVAARRLNEDARPIASARPDLPSDLARVIDRLMQRSPGDRYDSPAAMLSDLRGVIRDAEQRGWAGEMDLDASRVGVAPSPVSSNDRGLTARLEAAMRAESKRESRTGRRRLWTVVGLGLLAGAAFAWVSGRRPMVPRTQQLIERESTVQAQLLRAKTVGTPEGWLAIEQFFPEAEEFYHLLALRGYAIDRLIAGRPGQALSALERLAARKEEYPELAQFGRAGMVVALTDLGQERRARTALGALDADPERSLRQQSPELARALSRAIDRLNGASP